MFELDVKHIGREVRRLMVEESLGQKMAAERVATDIAAGENGRMQRLHESGALTFLCVKAEADTIYTDPIYVDGGDPARFDAPAGSGAPVHTRYDAFHADPLGIPVPVPGTGTRKVLREWTRDDVLIYRRWCELHIQTWRRKKKTADAVLREMGEDELLGQVWHRLSNDERALFPHPTGDVA